MKKIITTVMLTMFFCATAFTQSSKIPLIGSKAPSFTAETTNGQITFPNDFGKKWKILFSHPQDFTPVCSSELSELAYMQSDFKKLNAQIAVISADNLPESVRKDTATVDAIEIKINKIIPLKEAQQEMENAMFEKALELFPNKSVAADVLGIHRTTFSRKINKPEE